MQFQIKVRGEGKRRTQQGGGEKASSLQGVTPTSCNSLLADFSFLLFRFHLDQWFIYTRATRLNKWFPTTRLLNCRLA